MHFGRCASGELCGSVVVADTKLNKILKGHSQLMHMRIRYHVVADLHFKRHARETLSEKRIRKTLNKACRGELVTSQNRDYRP